MLTILYKPQYWNWHHDLYSLLDGELTALTDDQLESIELELATINFRIAAHRRSRKNDKQHPNALQ